MLPEAASSAAIGTNETGASAGRAVTVGLGGFSSKTLVSAVSIHPSGRRSSIGERLINRPPAAHGLCRYHSRASPERSLARPLPPPALRSHLLRAPPAPAARPRPQAIPP